VHRRALTAVLTVDPDAYVAPMRANICDKSAGLLRQYSISVLRMAGIYLMESEQHGLDSQDDGPVAACAQPVHVEELIWKLS
jgi:hypothetical protein